MRHIANFRVVARAWSPLLALAIVMTVLQVATAFHPALANLLEWSRLEMAEGQWWRLLTGHWVHLGMNHLGLNLAGLMLLCVLFDPLRNSRHQRSTILWLAGYLLAAPVAISLGLLWAVPELDWYRGFSGCLHGLFVLLALANLPRQPLWNSLLLVGLAVKLALEPYVPTATAEVIGAPVIYQAHWSGSVTGLVAGLLLVFRETQRPPSPE